MISSILEILILSIGFLLLLFYIFVISVFLFTPSRDSFGCINECVGCNGMNEKIYDKNNNLYVSSCTKCPYNPELYEYDFELMMDVRKKKK